jgi:hypothetical protein
MSGFEPPFKNFNWRNNRMKKLLVIALGLGIALGTVSFAQDSTDKKMEKKKKKGDKKTDETK